MIITLHLNPYPFDLVVIIDETDKAIEKFVNKSTTCSDKADMIKKLRWNHEGKTGGFFICSPNNESFIRLRRVPNNPYDISLLTHESLHAVIEIFRRIGIELSFESEEAYTYLLDHIVKEVLTKITP